MPLNTPTVTYTDNADSSGVTAVISGSTAGSTNRVYGGQWSAGMVGVAWSSLASRVGDGSVVVPVSPLGLYSAVVRSELAGEQVHSLIQGFRATDGEDATHYQLCVAVKEIIQALSLTGTDGAGVLDPTKIVVMKLPWRGYTEIGALGIIVTPIREVIESADNDRDDVDYRIQVSFLEAHDGRLTTGLDWGLMRRQRVIRAFSEHEIPGVTGHYITYVDPGTIIVPEGVNSQYDVGGVLLHCHAKVTRVVT